MLSGRKMLSRTMSASRAICIVGMLRGEGEAQPRGAGRHGRRADGGGEEAFVFQQARGRERGFCLAEDHRHDRALRLRQAGGAGEGCALASGSAA